MISAKTKISARKTVKSFQTRYLELLDANSIMELEERVVSSILNDILRINPNPLPIRLSKIAHQFSIEPRPEYISGSHDGEIQFDVIKKSFVIKLCRKNISDDRVRRLRERFTYAHEMAHRFFYIKDNRNDWNRALDVLTFGLPDVESIKARRTLNALEEKLCNRIASRILMPDSMMKSLCNLPNWWLQREKFYRKLSKTSQLFDVSRECLLVGISSGIRREVLEPPDAMCFMVISRSSGPVTNRGREALRTNISVFPHHLNGDLVADPFPGFEVERFGAEAETFCNEVFSYSNVSHGQANLRLTLSTSRNPKVQIGVRLKGWWQFLNSAQDRQSPKRLFVWGSLNPIPL